MEAVKTGSAEDWIRECFNDEFDFVANDEFMHAIISDFQVTSSSTDSAGSNYSSPTGLDMASSPPGPDMDMYSSPLEDYFYHQAMTLPPFCTPSDCPLMEHKVLGVDLHLFQADPLSSFACVSSSSCSSPTSSTSSSSSSSSYPSPDGPCNFCRQGCNDHCYGCIDNTSHQIPDLAMRQVVPDAAFLPHSEAHPSGPGTSATSTATITAVSTSACKSENRKVRNRKKRTNKQQQQDQPADGQVKAEDGTEKVFPCPYAECGNVYLKSSHLKVHIRRHTGEKPFKCTWQNCDWSFRRSDELSRHRRCHSGIKPYECTLCGKSFARSDHLSKHMKVHRRSGSLAGIRKGCDLFDDDEVKATPGRRRRHYMSNKSGNNTDSSAASSRILPPVGRLIQVQN